MTSGSISKGSPAYDNSGFYERRDWSGNNGKFQVWSGGIRVQWNSYWLERYGFKCKTPTGNNGYGAITYGSMVGIRSLCKWTANDDLRLLDKLAQAVRGHSFDLAINIGEAAKSYSMIVTNLRSIGAALVFLKHGRIGDAYSLLGVSKRRQRKLTSKDVSGRWLEMQYGWLPLVSQAYEAGKALEAVTGPRVLRFMASTASKTYTYNGSQSPNVYTYPVTVRYSRRLIAELSEDIGVGRSLGLTNPLQVAWELVPYSFVVDWFVPVGTYLSAWSIIPKLKGRFLTIQRAGQKAGSFSMQPGFPPGFKPDLGKVETFFSYERTASDSLSLPRPTFNSLPKALSPKRLLNAVALIRQLL